jgi:hypothetical protein
MRGKVADSSASAISTPKQLAGLIEFPLRLCVRDLSLSKNANETRAVPPSRGENQNLSTWLPGMPSASLLSASYPPIHLVETAPQSIN